MLSISLQVCILGHAEKLGNCHSISVGGLKRRCFNGFLVSLHRIVEHATSEPEASRSKGSKLGMYK